MHSLAFSVIFLALFPCTFAEFLLPVSNGTPVVFIPDAFHTPQIYQELLYNLYLENYDITCEPLNSTNSLEPKIDSIKTDADAIMSDLYQDQLNAGSNFFVIMHGYGALPGSIAAKGLSVTERTKAGKKGGIVGLIYIAGLIGTSSTSLQSMLPGKHFSSWINEYSNGQLSINDPRTILFSDAPSNETQWATKQLGNASMSALTSTSNSGPAWADSYYDRRRAYAFTLQDQMIPFSTQNSSLKNSNVTWTTQSFNTSHSPYLSQMQELSDWLEKTMDSWNSTTSSSR